MVKFIKACIAVFLILLMGAMAYVHFNQRGLSAKVLAMLRSQLTTELCVSSFNLDVFGGFPGVAFDLRDVELMGTDEKTCLTAKRLRAKISLWSLVTGDVRIGRLELADGEISVLRSKDGKLSCEVFKTGESSGESPGQELLFHRIDLVQMRLSYVDLPSDQEYAILFREGSVSGRYLANRLTLSLDADVLHDQIRLERDVFMHGASGRISGKLDLDFDKKLYAFQEVHVGIGKQQFEVSGSVRDAGEQQYLDFKIDHDKGEIGSLVALLPLSYRKLIPFSNLSGSVTARGIVQGRMGAGENPHVQFDFDVKNASLVSPDALGEIREIALTGQFDNGSFHRLSSCGVTLKEIEGKARGQHFSGSVDLQDFTDPRLHATFSGTVPADFILDYVDSDNIITEAQGALNFSDVEIGPVRMGTMNMTDIRRFRGKCAFDDTRFTLDKRVFQIREGQLILHDDSVTIRDVDARVDKDRIVLSGWATGLGDALESGDPAYLIYGLQADASAIHLDRWVPALAEQAGGEAKLLPVAAYENVPLRLPHGTVALKAVEFHYQDILIEALEAELNTSTHSIQYNCTGHLAGGVIQASGQLETSQGYALRLKLAGQKVQLRDCFHQFGNFGQNVIRAEHLSGKCDLMVLADIPWDLEHRLQLNTIHVYAGMSVSDGELVGFDMIDQFSTYVHAEDLKHVVFERMENFIEVKNGNVYIPAMFIQSNAANLVLNGVHTLDNHILYNLKINAGQILSNKMKKHNPTLTPLPARKDGTFNLHFTISGTVDSYTYAMDRTIVESSFSQSADMRSEIRAALRREFGDSVDVIEPPEWETIPEYTREVGGQDIYLDVMD